MADKTTHVNRGCPAPFSQSIVNALVKACTDYDIRGVCIDPFGGEGGVFQVEERVPGLRCFAIEIEQEWAEASRVPLKTICADSLPWMLDADRRGVFQAVITSPTYGNRMADHHNAQDGSHRVSYTHNLGRTLTHGSSGAMQWGREYREFHEAAWVGVRWILEDGGWFLLNVSDHIRNGEVQEVSQWHLRVCEWLGFQLVDHRRIETRRMRYGENREARVSHEDLFILRRGPHRESGRGSRTSGR